jgi:hypothetical protein
LKCDQQQQPKEVRLKCKFAKSVVDKARHHTEGVAGLEGLMWLFVVGIPKRLM